MVLPDFKALKHKVGVDDIAYSLGYRIDKSAGMGRYIEMTLPGTGGNAADAIVISNPAVKEDQTYFHRTTGRGGDVISLIKENISSFNVPNSGNIYERVGAVLCKFANEPIPEKIRAEYAVAPAAAQQSFEKSRFEVHPATERMFRVAPIAYPRGLEKDTLDTFAPHLVTIVDLKAKYQFENLGFPYTKPGSKEMEGAEWRGQFGKKGKVAGTNSSTAAWIADFSSSHGSSPVNARNVFFFESGFDAMAFYQKNKAELDLSSSVFVSLGGSFGEKQVNGIMRHYNGAKAWDCFDNDLPGRIFAVRMACIVEGKPLSYSLSEDKASVHFSSQGKSFSLNAGDISIGSLRKHMKLNREIGSWTAPAAYKDWNDCVLDVTMNEGKEKKSKLQMYDNLREKRKNSLKP